MYKYSEYFNIMLNLINLKENNCNLYLYYTSLYFDIFLAQGKINTPVHGNKFYLEGYIPLYSFGRIYDTKLVIGNTHILSTLCFMSRNKYLSLSLFDSSAVCEESY